MAKNNHKQAAQPAPANQHGVLDLLEKFLGKNKNLIIGIIIAVIAATAAWGVKEHIANQKYQQQWGGLFMANLDFVNSPDASLASLEDFAAKNPSTDAGVYAAFTLGNAYYQLKDYPKAEVYFKQAMAKGNKEIAPLAEVSLIAAQAAASNYAAAIAQADSFAAKHPAHFAIAQVKHYKALAQELTAQIPAAKEAYAAIQQDYPNTYYAAFAQLRLQELK